MTDHYIKKQANVAIKNILKEGLTDIFDAPFELSYLDNEEFVKKITEEVLRNIKSNNLSSFKFSEIYTYLMPKNHAFAFRKCALMHPIDTIKYFSLVLLLADKIEKSRIKISKKKIFSYRYKYDKNTGFVFNPRYTLTSFKQEAKRLSHLQSTKIIVSCDIANYYERLNLHRLENSLLAIGCDKKIVALINELLLFWSGRDSYGLPVGSNASRILAEANLIGVDNYLESNKVKFIRFVDDYRFFAKDANEAHYWLSLLIDRLDQEGLSINMHKTKIELKPNILKSKENIEVNHEFSIKEGSNPFIIKAGYGGVIPTKFRKPSERELINLREKNIEYLVMKIESNEIIEATSFIEVIKVCVATERYDFIERLMILLPKFLQITPYFLDTLMKYSDKISTDIRAKVTSHFSVLLNNTDFISEYLKVSYIKLLGHPSYKDKLSLLSFYRSQKKNDGAYSGRVILDSLYDLADRNIVMEIRKGFNRSNLWEKRQIIRIVRKVLDREENRPWIKNLQYVEMSDLFLQEIISPSTKKGNNRHSKK